jgi:hypothetical protein
MFNVIGSFSSSFSPSGRTRRGRVTAVQSVPSDPNLVLGTEVNWTNNTIWYNAGGPNPMGGFSSAVRPLIQVMYAHKTLRVDVGATTSLGIRQTQTGGRWRWQFSVSNTDNTIGDFSTPFFGSQLIGESSVVGGETYTGVTDTVFNIPAKRYFLIIRSPGPLYTSSTASPGNAGTNRTAMINGEPAFTTLSYHIQGSSTSVTNEVTNLPTQLGGSDAGYIQVNNYNPAFGITFTVV